MRQRWFTAKTRRITGIRTAAAVPLIGFLVVMLEVTLDDGAVQRYMAPLRASIMPADALDDPEFCRALLTLIARGGHAAGIGATLRGEAVAPSLLEVPAALPIRRLTGEQSNTSVLFGRALILKFFRAHLPGINPEVEIGRFLIERASFQGAPRLAGYLEYHDPDGTAGVAIVHELVDSARDEWEWMLEQLATFYAEARRAGGSPSVGRVAELAAPPLTALRRLGEQTAALHGALAAATHDHAFAPVPITAGDVEAWSTGIREQIERARAVLDDSGALPRVPAIVEGLGGPAHIVHYPAS